MKPLKSIYLFFIFVLLLVLFGFYACKKGTSETPEVKGTIITADMIIGKWEVETNYSGVTYQYSYQFNADGTFGETKITIDANKQPAGYQYISNGKFKVSGDKVIFTDVSIKYDDYYVGINQLAKTITQAGPIEKTIYVNGSRTEFRFVYPACPPGADCIGSVNYYKK